MLMISSSAAVQTRIRVDVLAPSGVLTQCRGGKTSAIIVLLLHRKHKYILKSRVSIEMLFLTSDMNLSMYVAEDIYVDQVINLTISSFYPGFQSCINLDVYWSECRSGDVYLCKKGGRGLRRSTPDIKVCVIMRQILLLRRNGPKKRLN